MTLFKSWGSLGSDYPGVGGGTPIFSYIFRFVAIFVSKFQKSNTFGSMKICGFFFFFFFFFGGGGGHYEIGLFWGGVISIGRFMVKIQNGNIFLGRFCK